MDIIETFRGAANPEKAAGMSAYIRYGNQVEKISLKEETVVF